MLTELLVVIISQYMLSHKTLLYALKLYSDVCQLFLTKNRGGEEGPKFKWRVSDTYSLIQGDVFFFYYLFTFLF